MFARSVHKKPKSKTLSTTRLLHKVEDAEAVAVAVTSIIRLQDVNNSLSPHKVNLFTCGHPGIDFMLGKLSRMSS